MSSQNNETGTPRKIYFDDEALAILEAHASAIGDRKRSLVVCALLRALAGRPAKIEDAPIVTQLKRVFGREQFVSFLGAVSEVIGAEAKAIPCEKAGGLPEAWIFQAGLGVLAFFQATEANIGDIFTKASRLMADYSLNRVIVATTNGHTLDGGFRQRLAGAGIDLVALADLRSAIHEATGAATSAGGKSGAGSVVDQVLRAAAAKKSASRPARSGSR